MLKKTCCSTSLATFSLPSRSSFPHRGLWRLFLLLVRVSVRLHQLRPISAVLSASVQLQCASGWIHEFCLLCRHPRRTCHRWATVGLGRRSKHPKKWRDSRARNETTRPGPLYHLGGHWASDFGRGCAEPMDLGTDCGGRVFLHRDPGQFTASQYTCPRPCSPKDSMANHFARCLPYLE